MTVCDLKKFQFQINNNMNLFVLFYLFHFLCRILGSATKKKQIGNRKFWHFCYALDRLILRLVMIRLSNDSLMYSVICTKMECSILKNYHFNQTSTLDTHIYKTYMFVYLSKIERKHTNYITDKNFILLV